MKKTDIVTNFSKAPTIHDVAAALGMHKSTVSLALSGKGNVSEATRRKVTLVANELGYQPNPLAQRLANGVSKNLVCLCSGLLDVGLGTEKILLIQKELTQRSLEVPIYTFSPTTFGQAHSQAAQVRQLCRQQPRAIICAGQMFTPDALRELEIYLREGGIVVSYDIPVPLPCDQVVFDREDNAYQAARHLIEHGHRRIGISISRTTAPDVKESYIAESLRFKGFRRALSEAGCAVHDEWVFRNQTYEYGGLEMAQQFLQTKNRPTGMCVVNDYVAMAFMVEAMRAGVKVPQELSIVGHDNQPIASLCPVPLTATSQPHQDIAHTVVEMLLERISGYDAPPRTVTLKGHLIQRESVAAPA